jgi:hypothetical protein
MALLGLEGALKHCYYSMCWHVPSGLRGVGGVAGVAGGLRGAQMWGGVGKCAT